MSLNILNVLSLCYIDYFIIGTGKGGVGYTCVSANLKQALVSTTVIYQDLRVYQNIIENHRFKKKCR